MRAASASSCLVIAGAILLFESIWCFAEISVEDDARRQVTIDRPARRIIAIAPNLAELVYAAGAGERLIATVRGADYPPDVTVLPSVGDASGLDFERVRHLEPDLILAWGSGNKPADLERLEAGPITTVVLEPRSLADISRHMRIVGKLAGTETVADAAADRFERRLLRLRKRYSGTPVIDVVVEIWHQPVFTVGDAHPLSDALRVCGGRNALGAYPLLAGPVPLEDILAAHPDVILSLTGMPEADTRARWREHLPLSGHHPARLVSMDPDLLTRPGPRVLDGVELLCGRLDQLRLDQMRDKKSP